MEKVDVLVIGGSAAGLVSMATGKAHYPDKEFLAIRKEPQAMIPCGIPYIFGTVGSTEKNILPDALATKVGGKVKIDEVVSIDRKNKICITKEGSEIYYEKLIIATGSTPKVPEWLNGRNLKNVFTVPKNQSYLTNMLEALSECKRIVTIGAGFIGVEMSDELKKAGKEVTIVELLPNILGLAFDQCIAVEAEEVVTYRGISLKTGTGVKEILGINEVTGVLLANGETLEADAVILSMGYRPKTELADKAGIATNEKGFIKVDEYMRTNDPDIFAVGDCAEKRDFITRKATNIMLASTACAEARVAGMNLYKLSTLKTFEGTIAIFSTAIGPHGFGAAGLTETEAIKENFDVVTGFFTGIDRHPGVLADAHKQIVKLIVSGESGVVLGGEVAGGLSAGELINVLGIIIQNRMTIHSLLTTQIGTQPLLTASPAAYPVIKAAEDAAKKIREK